MTGSDTSTPQTPGAVAAVAERLSLGALLHRVGNSRDRGKMALTLLITGVAALVLLGVIGALRPDLGVFDGVLRIIVIGALAYGIVAIIWSVIVMLRPWPVRYLFEGGLVETRRNKPRAARWSDVASVQVQYHGHGSTVPGFLQGKIKQYRLVLKDGGQFVIPSADAIGELTPFETTMLQLLGTAGVPTSRE